MPRKPTGEKLEKVVSTKMPVDDFKLLEKYASFLQPKPDSAIPYIACIKMEDKALGKGRHGE